MMGAKLQNTLAQRQALLSRPYVATCHPQLFIRFYLLVLDVVEAGVESCACFKISTGHIAPYINRTLVHPRILVDKVRNGINSIRQLWCSNVCRL